MPKVTFLENTEEDVTSENKLCKICTRVSGKYTCPRCSISYCSLPCYQSEAHSSCSEEFYKECVLKELGAQDGDADAERKMQEILHRIQQNDVDTEEQLGLDSDDECEPDLSERLTSINLDDADSVWEKLTPAERQEFEDLVRSGDVSQLVPPWNPWWKYRKEKRLVVEVETEGSETNADSYVENCPAVRSDIPPLSKITKAIPSLLISNNVTNVVGAYCYVARWFNGDHLSYSSEAVQAMTTLSGNLSHSHNYQSCSIALEAVAHEAVNCTWLGGSPETVAIMKNDVSCILAGPDDNSSSFYLQAALSDVLALLVAARRVKKDETRSQFARRFGDNLNAPSPAVTKDTLRLCVKKMEYFLSWAQEHAVEICSSDYLT